MLLRAIGAKLYPLPVPPSGSEQGQGITGAPLPPSE